MALDRDQIVYLDNAATSWPKPAAVVEAVTWALAEGGGNPGRGAHSLSLEAARTVHAARGELAGLLGVRDSKDLSFQAGCTAALNLALCGLIGEGDRVVVANAEHNSVVRPLYSLAAQHGVRIERLAVSPEGVVDPDLAEELVREAPTRALVVQQASSVSGAIQPIPDLADVAHAAGAILIVDGAQAAGHLPVNIGELGADAWACSGHKGLLGPQGTGLLYLSPEVDAAPLIVGGTGSSSEGPEMTTERPDRYEAGTANVPGIAGLGAAARFLAEHGEAQRAEERRLIRLLHAGLLELGFDAFGPEPGAPRVPLVTVTHPSIPADRLAFELDRRFGIAVRAGLHCAPWAHRAVGSDEGGAVRFSVGFGVSDLDIAAALEACSVLVREARA